MEVEFLDQHLTEMYAVGIRDIPNGTILVSAQDKTYILFVRLNTEDGADLPKFDIQFKKQGVEEPLFQEVLLTKPPTYDAFVAILNNVFQYQRFKAKKS